MRVEILRLSLNMIEIYHTRKTGVEITLGSDISDSSDNDSEGISTKVPRMNRMGSEGRVLKLKTSGGQPQMYFLS